MVSPADRLVAALLPSKAERPPVASRSLLLSDLADYIQRKKSEEVPEAGPRRYTAVQEAVLSVLGAKELSPGDIASEVAKLRDLPVSQKSVGIAIHELAKQEVIEMTGPALYRRLS